MKIKKNKNQLIFKGGDRGMIYGLFFSIDIKNLKFALKEEKKRLKHISLKNRRSKTYKNIGKFEFNPKSTPFFSYNLDQLDLLVVKEYEQFLNNGNYEHIYKSISILHVFALNNDLIRSTISYLSKNYQNALFVDNQKLIKTIEKVASNLGKHLLNLEDYKRNIKGKKKSKSRILFVRLSGLEDFTKLGRSITYDDMFKYIKDKYNKNHTSLKKRSDNLSLLTEYKSLLKKYNNRIKREKDKKRNEQLLKERTEIIKKIKNLENEENSIHKEAKRKTISELYQITGIEIGTRVLEEILAEANIRSSR